jgi:hypothetical protein
MKLWQYTNHVVCEVLRHQNDVICYVILQVIEAHYLYGVDYDNIEIVIHPQSIIHSMIETADSSVLAQVRGGGGCGGAG